TYTATSTTPTHPLSLHDALPISGARDRRRDEDAPPSHRVTEPHRRVRDGKSTEDHHREHHGGGGLRRAQVESEQAVASGKRVARSEEHTSELQSPYDLVCRLLLE